MKMTGNDMYFVFNHVDIYIEYHKDMNHEWGDRLPHNAGRIIMAKLEPRRYGILFYMFYRTRKMVLLFLVLCLMF